MNLFETFSDPTLMHAAAVHLPLAMSVFGVILLVLSAIFHRQNTVRAIALLAYVVLVGSVFVAEESGEGARSKISNTAPAAVWDLVEDHELMAQRVKVGAIATGIFLLISLLPQPSVRTGMLLLASVSGLVTLLVGAFTGHLGGSLVYKYGVGTPVPAWTAAAPPQGDGLTEAPVIEEEGEVTLLEIMDIDLEIAAYVSYTEDIVPLIQKYCIDCHEGSEPDGAYDMSTVANMRKAGEKAGPGIIPGKPDESPVVQYIRGLVRPQMPKGEDPLDIFQLHTFREWIAAGAVDDSVIPEEEAAAAPPEPAQTGDAEAPMEREGVIEAPTLEEALKQLVGDDVTIVELPPAAEKAPAIEEPAEPEEEVLAPETQAGPGVDVVEPEAAEEFEIETPEPDQGPELVEPSAPETETAPDARTPETDRGAPPLEEPDGQEDEEFQQPGNEQPKRPAGGPLVTLQGVT